MAKGSTSSGQAVRAAGSCEEFEEVALLLAMTEDDKLQLGKNVLEAAVQREHGLRATAGAGDDYGKSFGGTKTDTQVNITLLV